MPEIMDTTEQEGKRLPDAGLEQPSSKHSKLAAAEGPRVFELAGQYYQLLGYAWDHQVKDFRVLYRPLYQCEAKAGRFEAHSLAVSTFERWEEKFREVPLAQVPEDVVAMLEGPLPLLGAKPAPLVGALPATVTPSLACTVSGHGTRSCNPPTLETILGDYPRFIDTLLGHLAPVLDVSKYEMDHICYRSETVDEYNMVCQALCPAFGEVMVESLIGGRTIATIRLKPPICHGGLTVSCVEVPCPKAGSEYARGLEHAEFVIGTAEDGVHSNARLLEFVAQHPELSFDTKAVRKDINADVSLRFDSPDIGRTISVKFHNRPLYEVVEYELAQAAASLAPIASGA